MEMAIDPVCGMRVEIETAKFTHEHGGQTYYFCGKGCMLDFQEEPAKYTHPDWQPQGMHGMEHHGGM